MEKLYTLKEAKKLLGITTKTIQRWDKEGKIRVVRTIGGRRRIPESEIKRVLGVKEERVVVGYARVSSTTQKDDLERQKQLMHSYAKDKGYGEIQILSDVGSGLNENRKNFLKLLEAVAERKVSRVIVAYEDRLTRFGFETLRKMFQAFGTTIEVINSKEKTPQEELVEDLITIVSHFAGKLYGMRSHKYKELVEGVKKLVSG
ncbi:MAG: IS607 family transposase [Candidatus Verstraetearchaeota archaeon]|nr:IS607 family transposase [Candidatus Verstraetearchaeota archaeon]